MKTRWLQLEYIGKGLALALIGLLGIETLFVTPSPEPWQTVLFFALAGIGLLLLLGWAAIGMMRRGHRIKGRLLPFLLFLLLENPTLVYGGLLGGLLVGAVVLTVVAGWEWWHLLAALGGGIVLGFVFFLVRELPNRWIRGGTVLALAAAGAVGLYLWFLNQQDVITIDRQQLFALHLLLAIPILYLLTLAGRAEETE